MFANNRLTHNNDPLLVVQNSQAVAKYVGEFWQVSRKESVGDIDAVMATIMALYVSSAKAESGIGVY